MRNLQSLFDSVKGLQVKAGYTGERPLDAAALKFSGRVFLYTEDVLSAEQVEDIVAFLATLKE